MSTPIQGCDGGETVPNEDQCRAAFSRHLQSGGRRFSGTTWKEYVSVLRNGKDPAGYTREGIRSRKRRIIADYRWDDKSGNLVYRKTETVAAPEHQIYDIIKSEYERFGRVTTHLHTRCVSPKYHNITVTDVRKWLELQRIYLDSSQQANERDTSGSGGRGNDLTLPTSSSPSRAGGDEALVANADRLPLSDGRAVQIIREDLKHRKRSEALASSRYMDVISGLA